MKRRFDRIGIRIPNTKCPKSGKTRYPDKKTAMTVRNSFMHGKTKAYNRFNEFRIYPCPDCKGWHLTKILNEDNYD